MDYKKIAQIEFFLIMAALGIFVEHDSYHMFLAIGSAMFTYFFACIIFRGKGARFMFFIPATVVVCQLSVTFKRAIIEQGFREAVNGNPTGFLFADILYGFRHIVTTVLNAFWGFKEVIAYDKYSSIEALNYRFITIIIMLVIMTIFILKKEPSISRAIVKK